jgi:hypothetical protein
MAGALECEPGPAAREGTGRLDNVARDHDGSAGANYPEVKIASHVFLVRLWLEETPERGGLWKGRVQHILRGQSYAFTGPEMLIDRIAALVAHTEHPGASNDHQEHSTASPERPEETGS